MYIIGNKLSYGNKKYKCDILFLLVTIESFSIFKNFLFSRTNCVLFLMKTRLLRENLGPGVGCSCPFNFWGTFITNDLFFSTDLSKKNLGLPWKLWSRGKSPPTYLPLIGIGWKIKNGTNYKHWKRNVRGKNITLPNFLYLYTYIYQWSFFLCAQGYKFMPYNE